MLAWGGAPGLIAHPKSVSAESAIQSDRGFSIPYVLVTFADRNCVRPRLSLSQRERMKVRVCFVVALQVRTRLLATRCRALGEPDGSRIATQRLHGELGIPIASDREFALHDRYVHRHPIRSPALRWDNRNPRRSLRR